MKTLKELLEQRKAAKVALTAILDKAKTDKDRALTAAEQTDHDARAKEISDVDVEIDKLVAEQEKRDKETKDKEQRETAQKREERAAQLEREMETQEQRRVPGSNPGGDIEVRVHDNFPMLGEARAFTAVYGNERRGREQAYRSGMWILANVFGNDAAKRWVSDNYRESRSALSNVSVAAGAVLVPDALLNTIIWNVEQRGVFRANANIVPMGMNDVITVPKSAGEVTVYAVAEDMTADVTESAPTFGGVELIARTWGALVRVGRNLADDAVINIAEYLSRKIGYGVADKQDLAGFTGDGTSTYHNIYGLFPKIDDGTHTASIYTAATGHTAFSSLTSADFEGALGQLPQWAEGPDVAWYISKKGFYASMARLMDAAGGNTQDNVEGGKSLQFLGIPVKISQVLNGTLGAQTSTVVCGVGSLNKTSGFAQKKELSIQILTEKYAAQNQIGVLAFTRFGINNHELGDTSAAGSFIGLKTPGS
jgi:HK97 family phage major capsid protein